MPRPATLMLRLLTLLLLLLWGFAVSPHSGGPGVRRPVAAGEVTIICSPGGLRSVHLGLDGRPAEPPPPTEIGCCLLCQGPQSGVALLPVPALPSPRMVAAPNPAMAQIMRRLAFLAPPATHRSRAPPVS